MSSGTSAPMSYLDLAQLPEEELGKHDLAEVSLACAQGLPGAERVDLAACQQTLDRWARRVEKETHRMRMQFARRPQDFHHSRAYFRILVLVTVLQRDIGIRYNPQLIARDDFFTDARNLFLHGVIETKQGTCSSLPPLYIAVGRRLGYPLKLVTTAEHFFARWDEPGRERFNIECTSRGLNTHPDEYYLTWPAHVPPDQLTTFGLLKSKTPRDELADLITVRGNCWQATGDYRQAAHSYARAWGLVPHNQKYPHALRAALLGWNTRLCRVLPPPWPSVRVLRGSPTHRGIPWPAQADILRLEAMELFSQEPQVTRAYTEPIRRSSSTGVPLGLPHLLVIQSHRPA